MLSFPPDTRSSPPSLKGRSFVTIPENIRQPVGLHPVDRRVQFDVLLNRMGHGTYLDIAVVGYTGVITTFI